MAALRLGVACAVLDAENRILLSQRGDLGVWNLPSGRLDSHEILARAAIREVREETGIEAADTQPLGLYYYAGWRRMNVLYVARASAGELVQATYETRANGFFAHDALPAPLIDTLLVRDVFEQQPHLAHIEVSPSEFRRLRRKFAWRWVMNFLRGQPEPRYPRFTIHASLAMRDDEDNVLSLPNTDGSRILPGLECDGESPIWEQVRKYARDTYDLYELRHSQLRWLGLFQNPAKNRLEFIFATRLAVATPLTSKMLQRTPINSRNWWQGYQPFVEHLVSTNSDAVLTIVHQQEQHP
jgi:8-oxo-dGTP pyrophosphatase MutT (NUDIX family)